MTELNLTPYITIAYFSTVLFLGILSLITIGILFKHAEKSSVATSVSFVYAVLFALVFLTSLITFSS